MSDGRADLIELHIAFDRPKAQEHMERIAVNIRRFLQSDLTARFPAQQPTVYVADVRGETEDEDAS